MERAQTAQKHMSQLGSSVLSQHTAATLMVSARQCTYCHMDQHSRVLHDYSHATPMKLTKRVTNNQERCTATSASCQVYPGLLPHICLADGSCYSVTQ